MKRSVQLAGVWIVSAIVIGAAAPATAQTMRTPSVDASIGYQILHLPDETFPVGWNADVSGALNDMWRIVGEFGMSVDDQNEPGVSGNLKYYHAGVGPRIVARARSVQPFAQLLGGFAHTRANLVLANSGPFSDNDWAFMLQPGVMFTGRQVLEGVVGGHTPEGIPIIDDNTVTLISQSGNFFSGDITPLVCDALGP